MKTDAVTHQLPPLPYPPAALSPHIDVHTMHVHHDGHHAAYVAALNDAIAQAPTFAGKSAEWLLLNVSQVPEKLRTAVRRNAGGHLNHSLLWQAMAPPTGGAPSGPLADAIRDSFGGFDAFKQAFEDAGSQVFGGGWVWLVAPTRGNRALQIMTTLGHDNPLVQGRYPVLVNDVWEHAYYLQYEQRRIEYLRAWWPIVNWPEAERRFAEMSRTSASAVTPPQSHPLQLQIVK